VIPNLETIDLAGWLGQLRADGTTATRAGQLPGQALELVHVAAGERWETGPFVNARSLIVLDGLGTIAVDDWRATLGAGHAAGVPSKRKVSVGADADQAIVVLLIGVPEVVATEAEASIASLPNDPAGDPLTPEVAD